MNDRRISGSALLLLAFVSLHSCAMAQQTGHRPAIGNNHRDDPISLEKIMSDPDWIGNSPQGAYFADDGKSIFYSVKQAGSEQRDLIEIDLSGNVLRTVSDAQKPFITQRGGDETEDRTWKIYSRRGDLFLKNLQTGALKQLTRTSDGEHSPQFLADENHIAFNRGSNMYIRDLNTGIETQVADLRMSEAPKEPGAEEDKKNEDYLTAQQERLFDFIRKNKQESIEAQKRRRAEEEADETALRPYYLGDKDDLRGSSLSPDEKWLLVQMAPKSRDRGKPDTMPNYVTADGYVSTRQVRSKVGTSEETGESLVLIDLVNHTQHPLDLSVLPGISDDPFAADHAAEQLPTTEDEAPAIDIDELSADADESQPESPDAPPAAQGEKPEPKPRKVSIGRVTWADDSSTVVFQATSTDNKDRWIATVDLEDKAVVTQHHLHDDAWINWRFSDCGFLKSNQSIYYLSEETGYSNLYVKALIGTSPRNLTPGDYEVSDVQLSHDGSRFYYTANAQHPGIHEVYSVEIRTAQVTQLTHLGGENSWSLSDDETHLLITHSEVAMPPELYVQETFLPDSASRVTFTVSREFLDLPWIKPEIVAVPSSKVDQPIYSRLYLPPDNSGSPRPAVVFIHGAGYLQDAHQGWSYYFHEFMFHSLLAYRGYVVLDMDYRASAGYGRDWRTAIYRQMGTPELEDLRDGVNYLVQNCNVDRRRIGTYGGSYGGFLTLMAMFKDPDLFACGAALRPVTDWAHYNHGYTANILDTPAIAPQAYEASSPIEFADGLAGALLICHGMEDDNVFVQDSVRLAQRLIELKKDRWELALFPVEAHGFEHPTSWLNEFRRILHLFEENLEP